MIRWVIWVSIWTGTRILEMVKSAWLDLERWLLWPRSKK